MSALVKTGRLQSVVRTAAFPSASGHCEWLQGMTAIGRRLPLAGIAKAIDCVTARKGWSRPNSVIQTRWRERQLSDRKAAVQ